MGIVWHQGFRRCVEWYFVIFCQSTRSFPQKSSATFCVDFHLFYDCPDDFFLVTEFGAGNQMSQIVHV